MLAIEGASITLIIKKTQIKNQEITEFKVSIFPKHDIVEETLVVNSIKAFFDKQLSKIITIDYSKSNFSIYDPNFYNLFRNKIKTILLNSKNFNLKFLLFVGLVDINGNNIVDTNGIDVIIDFNTYFFN